MSKFKKCPVVMLPTNKKANSEKLTNMFTKDGFYFTNGKTIAQFRDNDSDLYINEIYILSDDEIKKGDWILNGKTVTKCTNPEGLENRGWKKIIATTDESLFWIKHDDTVPYPKGTQHFLPKPSRSFIEKYIGKLSRGNKITEVMVEYEEYGLCIPCNKQGVRHCAYPEECGGAQTLSRVKVNPKDNTITIKKVKESWNKKEVIKLLEKYQEDLGDNCPGIDSEITKWIKENL